MCGIAGLVNYPKNRYDTMVNMLKPIVNRGPDGSGIWEDRKRNVVFGHRRLAIIDLSDAGKQPMVSHSGKYVITYNGEIYNFHDLKSKLVDDGFRIDYRGRSDTEVLIEAIEAYGIKETLAFVKGMFALAVYDIENGTIQLARDRMGEKPLYYGFVGETFVFGSSIKSFECIDGFSNKINVEALGSYFRNGVISDPDTIYKDIYMLEPGMMLETPPINEGRISISDFKIESYWSIIDVAIRGLKNPFKGTREEAEKELEKLLKSAIKHQCISDVPIGAFLSSGIDSSTIVALMQEVNRDRVKTYTIGVENPDYNEADVAKQVAEIIGTDHTDMYISIDEMKEAIPKVVDVFDEPFADSSQIPSYFVSLLAQKHVTVAMSGEGADELFGGYNSYKFVDQSWRKVRNIPYTIRKSSSKLVSMITRDSGDINLQRRLKVFGAESATQLHVQLKELACLDKSFLSKDFYFGFNGGNTFYKDKLSSPYRNAMLYDSTTSLPSDILTKVDRTAMFFSLETRIPMFDKDVIEFAWSLPEEYLYQGGNGKLILRDILYKRIPSNLIERPKRGFSIPVDQWINKGSLREWAEDLINRASTETSGLLDSNMIKKTWDNYVRNNTWTPQIWYLLMFLQWYFQ